MDAVELTIEPRVRPVGGGEVLRLLPWRARRTVGPFIFADLVGPDTMSPGQGTDVDAHPHIGLSTVTYLFAGRTVHRDSTGAVQTIEPGAINWMTAGSGVTHTERSHPSDRVITRLHHGLQTWVALPDDAEDIDPAFAHHSAADLPVESANGARIRVLAGTSWGIESPVAVSSPLILAEVNLGDDGTLLLDDTQPERAVLAIDDDIAIEGHRLKRQHMAVIERGARPTLTGRGRVMVLGGEPVGKRTIWWNFVHSDPERIEAAKADWAAQRFPVVPNDHDSWVPLPA